MFSVALHPGATTLEALITLVEGYPNTGAMRLHLHVAKAEEFMDYGPMLAEINGPDVKFDF